MTGDGSSHDACVEFIAECYFSRIQPSFGILANVGPVLFEKHTTISSITIS